MKQLKDRLEEVKNLRVKHYETNHSDDLKRIKDEACYNGQIGALEYAIEMLEKEKANGAVA
jgi:hypothetical protein